MKNTTPTREILVQHAEWLQRLARQLAVDEDSARDLAQDTLVIALEHPPKTGDRLRGWLAKVMRNRAAERGRAAATRTARELETDAPNHIPGADEVVERIQLQRSIADHLLALPEATRTALVLRYFEDLPPRVIAERQGVPVATVKSRLARGLQTMRARLDAEHDGGRKAWVAVLLPWITSPTPSTPPVAEAAATGGTLSGTQLLVAAAAILAVGAILLDRGPSQETQGSGETATQADLSGIVGEGGFEVGDSSSDLGANRRPAASSTEALGAADAAVVNEVRGIVISPEGRALPNVRVRLRGRAEESVSGPGGAFVLETTADEARIEVAERDWVDVRTGRWSADGSIEAVLVVAPAMRISGTVSDEWGRRLTGVLATLEPPANLEARIGERLDSSYQEEWSTRTNAQGAFTQDRLPAMEGARLRFVQRGYEPVLLVAPSSSSEGIWVELRRPAPPEAEQLQGRVLRADGAPARDAILTLGDSVATVDEGGFFAMDLTRCGDALRLSAAEGGSRLAVLERGPDEAWPEFALLTLGGEALSIRGRVVDENGAPRAGGRVWIHDPTRLGRVGSIPIQVEAFQSGGGLPDEALESVAAIREGGAHEVFGSARPALQSDAILSWTTTDAQGRFSIEGLEERDYVLNAIGPRLHWGAQTAPIPAGSSEVRIATSSGDTLPVVRGRMVSEQDQPVAGATITSWISAFHSVEEFESGTSDVLRFFTGEAVTTDAQGRFELRDVPRAWVQFHVVSDDIVPTYFAVESIEDPADFVLEVRARAHLKITTSSAATSFRVVDAEGSPVQLMLMRADGYSTHETLPLLEGRSGVVSVTTDAAELLLERGDELLERVPLKLRPGEFANLSH